MSIRIPLTAAVGMSPYSWPPDTREMTPVPEILACKVDDLRDGESLKVDGDPEIAVYRVDGEFYATADSCTHEEWSLGEDGELEGHEIVCCLHLAAFDVRSGAVTRFPATEPLRTYPLRVADGEIWVDVD
jgi:nitrite reductase/ring-hydroxylating ferredoxin subunit